MRHPIFPDLWEEFIAPIPVLERSQLIEAYHRRLFDPDPAVHVPAGVAWSRWEAATLTLLPDHELVDGMTEPRRRDGVRAHREPLLPARRLVRRRTSSSPGSTRIRDIPAVIVQGRYDVCTPIMTAWDLHRAWPEAEFIVIPDAAHAATEPGIAAALRAATDRFAGPVRRIESGAADEHGRGVSRSSG